MSSFQTATQRKLAALKAANKQWQSRAAEREADEAAEEAEEIAQRKKHRGGDGGATVVSGVDADDAELVSDASAAEQAMMAAMFPASFGAAAKPVQDISAVHAQRERRVGGSSGASAAVPEVRVKVEGAPEEPPKSTAQAPPRPKKMAVPIAPAALLGGAYDSSDDDDEDGADGGAFGAAAGSSAAAGASSAAAAAAATMHTDDEESDDDDDDESSSRNPLLARLPISHEAELRTNGHTKSVSALCVDRAGGRVLSGGYDYTAKLWDFGGMNSTLAAFRTIEPQEGHQVRQLSYSLTGDMFLAVTGSARAKLYTREAMEVCEFARGDMYIMDQKQTKGHSSALTSGWWHPTDRSKCITSGIDGTVRVWDVNDTSKNLSVIKPRGLARGIAISATAFSKDGKIIATACTDGSLRLLNHSRGADYRDDKTLASAHTKSTETSSLLFASDGHTLFSRGGDGDATLKQWDIRAFRQPVHIVGSLPNAYAETDIALSPDERVLVTGTSSRDGPDAPTGQAIFIERASMRPIQRVSLGCTGVIRTVWHGGINQLLFGCSDGAVRLLYDPALSTKGALLCVGRKAKPKSMADYTESIGAILTPHALPSLRGESGSRKRTREKAAAALAPEAPIAGRHGVGGRAAGSQSMAAYHLSKVVSAREDPRAKDPREALLAMDELAKKDPMFFGNAYKHTQPVNILAEVPEDERQVVLTEEEIAITNKKEGQTH